MGVPARGSPCAPAWWSRPAARSRTPALLWRSGFRSPSGQLGRNLSLHPNAKLVALFDDEVYGWQGVHQAYQVREFMDAGILITAINIQPSLLTLGLPQHGRELGTLMQDYNRMVVAGCLIDNSRTGRVQMRPVIGPVVSYQISEQDAARIVRGISLTAELMFAAGARRVLLPFAGAPDLHGPADLADLQARTIPRDAIELLTVHLMGTARMSEDRRRGVVSSFGAFHDAEGLFVADASLFPGPIGVNPMETIMALVTRNAEWLIAHRSSLWNMTMSRAQSPPRHCLASTTYKRLVGRSRSALEGLLVGGETPSLSGIVGYEYRGYNIAPRLPCWASASSSRPFSPRRAERSTAATRRWPRMV